LRLPLRLGRVVQAHRGDAAGLSARAGVDELLAQHGRKHKLVPMLKALT
jgi:hypothetical protein